MNDFVTRTGAPALAALALVAMAPGLAGAQEVDRRWLPWTGCWEVVAGQDSDAVVCVGAGDDPSEIVLVDGNPETPDVRVRADGEPRAVDQFGCDGTERAWFAPGGSRVYTQGEYLCEDGVQQSSTGVLAMVGPDEWVDIRSLEIDGERVAWVQRYVAGTPGAVRAAGESGEVTPQQALSRRLAARNPTTADLVEVASVVDPEVASAWMAAVNAEFDLDGKTLLAMHEAGIDPEVIDVAIAVSHPERFVLGPEGETGARELDPVRTGYVGGPPVSSFGSCWGAGSFFLPLGPAFRSSQRCAPRWIVPGSGRPRVPGAEEHGRPLGLLGFGRGSHVAAPEPGDVGRRCRLRGRGLLPRGCEPSGPSGQAQGRRRVLIPAALVRRAPR